MKPTLHLFWKVLIVCVFCCTGCSKKSDTTSPSGTNDYASPTLAKDTLIKIPDQMRTKSTTDMNLYLGVLEIDIVNTFTSGLSEAFIYDQSTVNEWASSKNSDGSTSYSWNYMQYTAKVTYYHSTSESWWKYEEDSSSFALPLYYINDNGTSGEIDWYGQEYFKSKSLLAYKDLWTKTTDTKNSTFSWYGSDGTTVTTQYVSTSKTDKSGTLKVYGQNNSTGPLVLQWSYVWDKTGSGSYIQYKPDGITVLLQGTF
jgi:hypothetical protein